VFLMSEVPLYPARVMKQARVSCEAGPGCRKGRWEERKGSVRFTKEKGERALYTGFSKLRARILRTLVCGPYIIKVRKQTGVCGP